MTAARRSIHRMKPLETGPDFVEGNDQKAREGTDDEVVTLVDLTDAPELDDEDEDEPDC